jgi:copper chaperone CopZ
MKQEDFIMKKTFKLEGLDCANCAAKIETAVKGLEGVTAATVNFMTTKMVIEGDEETFDGIVEKAKAIVKKLEPDVIVKKA